MHREKKESTWRVEDGKGMKELCPLFPEPASPRRDKQQRICLPMHKTGVPSLGQEDSLEKEKATHSSVLAWEIPGTEEPVGLQSMGRKVLDMT